MNTFGPMFYAQRELSRVQATPVLGMPVSILKAVVSVAEIIVGVVAAAGFGAGGALSLGNQTMVTLSKDSVGHVALGIVGLVYSIANFFTATTFGIYVESKVVPNVWPQLNDRAYLLNYR